jgi:hypothetical protein
MLTSGQAIISPMANERITIEGVRAPGAPITHASYFHLTELNGDVILDIGAVDDQELVSQLRNPIDTDVVVKAHVSHRFGMSRKSLLQLQSRVNELVAGLEDGPT